MKVKTNARLVDGDYVLFVVMHLVVLTKVIVIVVVKVPSVYDATYYTLLPITLVYLKMRDLLLRGKDKHWLVFV